jgi:hypothetical protein
LQAQRFLTLFQIYRLIKSSALFNIGFTQKTQEPLPDQKLGNIAPMSGCDNAYLDYFHQVMPYSQDSRLVFWRIIHALVKSGTDDSPIIFLNLEHF